MTYPITSQSVFEGISNVPYTLTTQAQVDHILEMYTYLRPIDRYVGYSYETRPNARLFPRLDQLALPGVRARYQNHHEPEILPLP